MYKRLETYLSMTCISKQCIQPTNPWIRTWGKDMTRHRHGKTTNL